MSDSFDPKGGKGFRLGGFAGVIFPTVILGGVFLAAGILWTNREQFCRQFPDAPLICRPGTPIVPLAPAGPRDPGDPAFPILPENAPVWCGAECDESIGADCIDGFTCVGGRCTAPACETATGLCGDPCTVTYDETSGCAEPLSCFPVVGSTTRGTCGRSYSYCYTEEVPSLEERTGFIPAWCGAVCDATLGLNCPEGFTCQSGFCRDGGYLSSVCNGSAPAGACGAACAPGLINFGCDEELECIDGRCTDPEICVQAINRVDVSPEPIITLPSPVISPIAPASLDVCSSPDQNGIRWQGLTCTCEGNEVYTYICNNNQPIHQPTGNSCTPPADCPAPGGDPGGDPGGEPGDVCKDAVCGDGTCDFPACEDSMSCPADCFG